jgi:deoxycytidylate deaminase
MNKITKLKTLHILNDFNVINPCKKQIVKALIINNYGEKAIGSNSINNKVSECPRVIVNCKTGEGYEMCKQICDQNEHAEVMAIRDAKLRGISTIGAKLYLTGHTYFCNNCIAAIKKAGISSAFCHDSNLTINLNHEIVCDEVS